MPWYTMISRFAWKRSHISIIYHIILMSVLHISYHILAISTFTSRPLKIFTQQKVPHSSMIRFKLQICRIIGHTIEVQRQPSSVRTCQIISHLRGHSNCGQQCAVDQPLSYDTCDAELCKFSANLLTTEFHRRPCALSDLNMAELGVFSQTLMVSATWNHPSVMKNYFRKWAPSSSGYPKFRKQSHGS